MELSTEKLQKIQELLQKKSFSALRSLLEAEEAVDIAELVEELDESQLALVFRILPKDLASDVFVHLSSEDQETLINAYSDRELEDVLAGLYNDDLVEILEELPAGVTKRILRQTDEERRSQVNRLLQYPEDSAGSIMTTEYMRLDGRMTVKEAIHKLRHIHTRVEMIYTCFVTDASRILEGAITVAEILRAEDDAYIADLMDDDPHYALTTDDQEEVVLDFERYDLLAMPVLDKEKRLVGIITVDDAMEVMMEEVSEDHHQMAAVQTTDLPYPETGVFDNAKRRILWLMLLMLSGGFSALALREFQHVYLAIPILVTFMPMLTSTGGNAASQTTSMALVGLSTGELGFKDILQVLFKEFRIGLICGLLIATLNATLVYVLRGQNILLSLTIFISFFAIILVAKSIAAILPFLAKALRFDPALVVSPLITTIIDVVAIVIYYSVAAALFAL